MQFGGTFSDWSHVCSGVPQGSVLGPVLFTVFINYIDDDIVESIIKFADDTNLFQKIKGEFDFARLRQDFATVYKWWEDWQMLFNVDK